MFFTTTSSGRLISSSSLIFIFSSVSSCAKTTNIVINYIFLLYWFRFRSHKNTSNDEQNTVRRILTEFGLDPSDYIFNSSNEQPSAFTKYSPKKKSPILTGRPLTYAQQPPIFPPPPPILKRPTTQLPSTNEMLPRRTPPPPPTSVPAVDSYVDESKLSAEDYLRQIQSQENPPVKVVKPNSQNVVYRKEIRIRYLQPPTPPPPAPIIIREKHIPPNPPESVGKKPNHLDVFVSSSFLSSFLAITHSRKKTRTSYTTTVNYS